MSIHDYITSHCEVVKENFPEIHIVCPWCGDTRGKFQFNVSRAVGRCWRAACDQRATLSRLIEKQEQVPGYVAARKASALKRESGVAEYVSEEKDYSATGELPSGSVKLEDVEKCFSQLSHEEQLIVAAGFDYLNNKRNADYGQLVAAGCAIGLADAWKARILFPAVEDGLVVNVTGRLIEVELDKDCWVRYPDTKGDKYYHAPNDTGYVEKRQTIYGIDTIRSNGKVVIVEDCFSCLALRRAGYHSISFWGTSITVEQAAKLNAKWTPQGRTATILLDSDAAIAGTKMAITISKFAPVLLGSLVGADPDENLVGAKAAIEAAKPFTAQSEIESILLC